MRASDALQVPFVDLLYGDLSPLATKTRFGVAFVAMTLGYAIVTALVLLAWILDRPRLLWPAFLIGLGFASGLSLSGHQGVEPNSTFLTELADWLHLVAAILWVGGLVALAACVWPLAPTLRRSAFLGFSRIATVLVAVLVLAGTYLSISRLPTRLRPLDDPLRARLARQDRDRLRRAQLGSGAPLLRAATARARRDAGGAAAEPDRREHGRDARAARRRGARQRAPAAGGSRRRHAVGDAGTAPLSSDPGYPARVTLVSISGGAGFLGLHLARRVLADGGTVRTLDVAPLDDARARARRRGGPRRHPLRAGRARARRRRGRARARCGGAADPVVPRGDPLGQRRGHRERARRRAQRRRAARRPDLVDRRLRRSRAASDRRGRSARRRRVVRRVEDRGRAAGRGVRPPRARRRDHPAEDVHRPRAARRLRDPLRLDPRRPPDPDPRRRRQSLPAARGRGSRRRGRALLHRAGRRPGGEHRRGRRSAPFATTCRR